MKERNENKRLKNIKDWEETKEELLPSLCPGDCIALQFKTIENKWYSGIVWIQANKKNTLMIKYCPNGSGDLESYILPYNKILCGKFIYRN